MFLTFKNCHGIRTACKVLLFLLIHVQVYSQTDHIGSGRALRFDGLDDYVDLGNIYDDVALPVTLSVWIYIDPGTVSPYIFPIFDSQDNTDLYNGFAFATSSAPHIGLTYGDGRGSNNPAFRRSKSGAFQFFTGRWINIAGVIRGAEDMDLYLNGYNIGGTYVGGSPLPMDSNAPADVAKIGKLFSNGITSYFKGIMDELRIWNRALTETEIREQMCHKLNGNEPGLIGYWDFDETSGNVLYDKSTKHYNGQLMGNPTRVFSGAPVGDQSVYLYTNTWTSKTLTMTDDLDKIEVSGVTSNPYGVHLYKVTDLPSQQGNLPSATKPYFGVFTTNDNNDTEFDIRYFVDGMASCGLFSRSDNSIANWTSESSTTPSDFLHRREFIKASDAVSKDVDLGEDQVSCSVNTQKLTPVDDPTGLDFTWQDGSKLPTFTVSDFGVYWVKVKGTCEAITDTITFSKTQDITEDLVDLGEDEERCAMQSHVLIPVANPAGLEFTWQDGSKQSTFTVPDFGLYWVKVKGICGTVVVDSISFSKIQDNVEDRVDLGDDEERCLMQSHVLEPVADPAGLEFTWHDGSKQPTFAVSDFGVYWVKVKSVCKTTTDSITFSKIQDNLTVDLGEDEELCSVQDHILIPAADPSGLDFTWQDGSRQATFTVSDFGVYWVAVKSTCKTVTDSITFSKIQDNLEDLVVDLGEDEELCSAQSRILTAVNDSTGLEFTWQDGSSKPTFTASGFGVYWVTVKSTCSSVTDSITFSKVTINKDLIPNVITPNGDKLNDHFVIDERLSGVVSLQVLNRWGMILYNNDHYENNWDGEDLSAGVYFYVLSSPCVSTKGTINILR